MVSRDLILRLAIAVLCLCRLSAAQSEDCDAEFTIRPQDVVARVGEMAMMQCEYTNQEPVEWDKDGTSIISGGSLCDCTISGDGHLIFNNVTTEDVGVYTCVVIIAFLPHRCSATLRLAEIPLFTSKVDPGPTSSDHRVLSVLVFGDPTPDVVWLHNDEDTDFSSNSRVSISSLPEGEGWREMLTITDIQPEDRGMYTLQANNTAGRAEEHWLVPVFFGHVNPVQKERRGSITQLTCTGEFHSQTSTVKWLRGDLEVGGSVITTTNDQMQQREFVAILEVEIGGCGPATEVVKCQLKHDGNTIQQLADICALNVTFNLTEYTVNEGETVDVIVQLCGNATDDVVVTVTMQDGSAVGGSDYTSQAVDLTFNAANPRQTVTIMTFMDDVVEGVETFTVFLNSSDTALDVRLQSATVSIVDQRKVYFPSIGGSSHVSVGGNLNVTCDTAGSNVQVTSVMISSGGVVLASTNESSTSITITNQTLQDNGTVYVCTAVIAIGNTSENFSLIVQDRPAMVDITTLTSTLLSLLVATVSWTPPADNNSPITLYTISVCTLTGSTCSNVEYFTSSAPHVLLEVIPSYQYNVTVTATNDIGDSDTSDEGIVSGAVNSDSLVTLHTSLVTDTLVILQWTLPPLATTPDGIPIHESKYFTVTGYSLSMNMEPDTVVLLEGRDTTSHLYSHLFDSHTIFFIVTVVYSDSRINDNLNRSTILPVTIPSPVAAIPVRAMAPAAPVDLTSSGFVISWNVPDVNTDFLTGYEITIKVSPSRRKRQAVNDIVFNVSRSHTSFAFTDGKPFTNYTVSVDGLLSVNGVPGRVAALVATLLRTDEAVSSPPQNLQLADIGITSFTLQWDTPLVPNGILSGYEVTINSSEQSSSLRLSVPGLTAIVNGLRGNTNYFVTVHAVNGAGDGELSLPLSITTALGVYRPEIASVTANDSTGQYTLRINRFRTDYGDISHYFVYVVERDNSPDTSMITDTDLQGAYIAVAADVPTSTSSFTVVIGTGETFTYNNRDYTDRIVTRGTSYYFFVRLYSSADPSLFNDSTPVLPATILPVPPSSPAPTLPSASPAPTLPSASPAPTLPSASPAPTLPSASPTPTLPSTRPTKDKSVDTVAVVAGVLGSFAFVITVAFIALLVFTLIRGKRVQKHTFPPQLEDEKKVGVELQRTYPSTGQPTESSKTTDSVAVSGNVSVSRDQPNQDPVFEEMDANGHQEQAVLQKLL